MGEIRIVGTAGVWGGELGGLVEKTTLVSSGGSDGGGKKKVDDADGRPRIVMLRKRVSSKKGTFALLAVGDKSERSGIGCCSERVVHCRNPASQL